jgi:uncharacterized membrane protein YsdA (DUF1294 family)
MSGVPAQGILIAAIYAAASAIAFIAYGVDKRAARRGGRRIPESTLHALSLGGGWPGAFAAQQLFRHKTRKQPFRTVFWLTVAVNLLLLTGWFAASGVLTR